MCLVYELPPDGLPIHHSWLNNLKGIVVRGYENWRELLEIKLTKESLSPGDPLELGSVKAVKGLGRVAIILFSILFSYMRLRESWSEACRDDFVRLGPPACGHKSVVLKLKIIRFLKDDGEVGKLVFHILGCVSRFGDMELAKYREHEGPGQTVVFPIIWERVPIIWGPISIIWVPFSIIWNKILKGGSPFSTQGSEIWKMRVRRGTSFSNMVHPKFLNMMLFISHLIPCCP